MRYYITRINGYYFIYREQKHLFGFVKCREYMVNNSYYTWFDVDGMYIKATDVAYPDLNEAIKVFKLKMKKDHQENEKKPLEQSFWENRKSTAVHLEFDKLDDPTYIANLKAELERNDPCS